MNPGAATIYGLGYTLAMSGRAVLVARSTDSELAVKAVALRWATQLCQRCGVSVQALGMDGVDWSKPLVVIANHQSLFDVPVVMAGTQRAFGFLTKQELFRIPVFGSALERIGCVSVDRDDRMSARRSLDLAARRIRAGSSLVVFAEGTRSPDGTLLPFKKGPFFLVQAADVQAVPLAIVGTGRVLGKRDILVRGAKVELRVGRPLRCNGSTIQDREHLRLLVRDEIQKLMTG